VTNFTRRLTANMADAANCGHVEHLHCSITLSISKSAFIISSSATNRLLLKTTLGILRNGELSWFKQHNCVIFLRALWKYQQKSQRLTFYRTTLYIVKKKSQDRPTQTGASFIQRTEWMNEWMHKWMNEWLNEWMNERYSIRSRTIMRIR